MTYLGLVHKFIYTYGNDYVVSLKSTGVWFLVRWCFQRTLVPSFFFLLSFFLSAFFVFGLITYDWSVQTHLLLLLLWVLLLLRVCAGLRGCAQVCVCVCAGMCGYARVCVGMRRCWRVGIGVHKCALVCGCLRVCYVRGMNSQNIYWRIESLHQRTLIRILYEFL